jgi:peptidoglycan biosynthesis protein MviN/MurJ (putative lipid II flippase)
MRGEYPIAARSIAEVNKLALVLRRLPVSVLLAATALLVAAAPVLAHDNGEGWWGETNDRVVTNAGFVLIIFFPLFIFLVSLLQWRLEKRKDRRKAEAKRHAQTAGGW